MNSESLFNENWYRVSDLLPRLAPDVEISRHVYRLQPHYILRRASTRRWHRMSATAFEMLVQFDGQRSVAQVWQTLLATQREQAPDQSEIMALLAQLHDADMLIVDTELDARMLLGRQEQMIHRDRRQRFFNPLHVRIALMDPDRLIARIDSIVPRRCLLPLLIGVVLLLMLAGVAIAPQWQPLKEHLHNNQVFDPANLLLMAVLYPLMKLCHELAHALVVKRYGGEVREAGIAMLVLLPNPYVDASAASMFGDKYQRILVSAAGIFVELVLALLAVFVWLSSTGLLRDAALSVMVLGTVSTLLFNGNPLLKFDGYYILSDWLEIPNLATRSKQFLAASVARLVGLEPSADPVPTDAAERIWLYVYGLLALVYRIFLMALIAWMISGQYFFFGIILAAYIAVTTLLMPIIKAVRFASRQKSRARMRFASVSGALLVVIAGAAIAVPVPGTLTTDGIVWLPENSELRLEQSCEVVRVSALPGSMVKAGQALFDCADDDWIAQERILKAELRLLDAERAGLLTRDPSEHQRLSSMRVAAQDRYDLAYKRLMSTRVIAPVSGQFLVDGIHALEGRYLSANVIAGYVVPTQQRTVRVALTQWQASQISHKSPAVRLYFADDEGDTKSVSSSIARTTPRASEVTSVLALTTLGGGEFRAQPSESGAVLEQPAVELELAWPDALPLQMIGSRLRVRIENQSRTVHQLLSKRVHQLLQGRSGT